jgi:hypothetical protein
MEDTMNMKRLTSGLIAIVSLVVLTTAGCSIEPTSDPDEAFMGDDDEDTSAQGAALTNAEIILSEHRKIKKTYSYSSLTTYNGQTLPGCARQELNQINNSGVWQHYACTAGKVKNLYVAASTSSVPGVNWVDAVKSWKNSSGHLQTINNYSKVGCSQVKGTQTMCKNTFGNNFPYCRIYSCAYTN